MAVSNITNVYQITGDVAIALTANIRKHYSPLTPTAERFGGPFRPDVRDCSEAIRALSNDGAGAPEVEITPEMIEAGIAEYANFDIRFGPVSECVMEIYSAMARAKRTNSGDHRL